MHIRARNKIKCICLLGPDGSGKTTLAKIIASDLSARGFNVKIVWMRGNHLLARLLAILFSKFKTFAGSDNPFHSIAVPASLRRVWQITEFVSLLPIFFLRYVIPRALGYTVIADRFLPDFIVWISLTTKSPRYAEKFEARFLLALVHRISLNFYLKADIGELLRRKNDMTPAFMRRQVGAYDALAHIIDAYEIDTTSKTIQQASVEIMAAISKRLIAV